MSSVSRAELDVAKALEAKAKASQNVSGTTISKMFTKTLSAAVRNKFVSILS